jgi:hypothetical protein
MAGGPVIFLAAWSGSAAPSIPRQIEALLVKHRLARKRNNSKPAHCAAQSKIQAFLALSESLINQRVNHNRR